MKRKDIEKALRKAGFTITHGGSHDQAVHPDKPGLKISIPRHNEIKENTANNILKAAGLK